MANRATHGLKWKTLEGSREALKWNRRDLPHLDRVIWQCQNRRVAVQAGGNLGIWPKRLAETFESVYTFEPEPGNFAKLCANAPESNIYKFQAALGYARGCVHTSTRRRDGKPLSHEGIAHIAGPGGPVPVLRVDDLALPACDLLLLDVEGYELEALKGAEGTIRVWRPIIVVEINKCLEFVGLTPDQIQDWLTTRGYTCTEHLSSDYVYFPEARS